MSIENTNLESVYKNTILNFEQYNSNLQDTQQQALGEKIQGISAALDQGSFSSKGVGVLQRGVEHLKVIVEDELILNSDQRLALKQSLDGMLGGLNEGGNISFSKMLDLLSNFKSFQESLPSSDPKSAEISSTVDNLMNIIFADDKFNVALINVQNGLCGLEDLIDTYGENSATAMKFLPTVLNSLNKIIDGENLSNTEFQEVCSGLNGVKTIHSMSEMSRGFEDILASLSSEINLNVSDGDIKTIKNNLSYIDKAIANDGSLSNVEKASLNDIVNNISTVLNQDNLTFSDTSKINHLLGSLSLIISSNPSLEKIILPCVETINTVFGQMTIVPFEVASADLPALSEPEKQVIIGDPFQKVLNNLLKLMRSMAFEEIISSQEVRGKTIEAQKVLMVDVFNKMEKNAKILLNSMQTKWYQHWIFKAIIGLVAIALTALSFITAGATGAGAITLMSFLIGIQVVTLALDLTGKMEGVVEAIEEWAKENSAVVIALLAVVVVALIATGACVFIFREGLKAAGKFAAVSTMTLMAAITAAMVIQTLMPAIISAISEAFDIDEAVLADIMAWIMTILVVVMAVVTVGSAFKNVGSLGGAVKGVASSTVDFFKSLGLALGRILKGFGQIGNASSMLLTASLLQASMTAASSISQGVTSVDRADMEKQQAMNARLVALMQEHKDQLASISDKLAQHPEEAQQVIDKTFTIFMDVMEKFSQASIFI